MSHMLILKSKKLLLSRLPSALHLTGLSTRICIMAYNGLLHSTAKGKNFFFLFWVRVFWGGRGEDNPT